MTSYQYNITHQPSTGLLRVKLYEGTTLIHDTGDIIESDPIKGGRIGVWCNSQEMVSWSTLIYRYQLNQCQFF